MPPASQPSFISASPISARAPSQGDHRTEEEVDQADVRRVTSVLGLEPPCAGPMSHGSHSDDARSSSQELRKRTGLLRIRVNSGYLPLRDPIERRPPPREPPESVGRILLLSTGRLGVLSKRDERGKRKQIGVVATETDAQAAIRKALGGSR